MPGRCVLGCTMLVAALACRGPEAGPLALVPPETSQALKVLETTYGLRLPPPLALTVRKPEPNGPGRFHLVVQAPGWSLEGVLETLAVRTEAGPASTAFDWELPADRVGDYAGGAGWSLPLRLSKGGDHRPLIIQAKATQGRTGERAHEAAEIVSLLPIAAVAAPFALLDLARGPDAAPAPPLPGPAAPPCTSPGATRLVPSLERDPGGRRYLRLRVDRPGDPGDNAPRLADLAAALAAYAPERAATLAADPTRPGAFRLDLAAADLERPFSFLLLERFSYRNGPEFGLWTIYADPAQDWAKAWRLTTGDLGPWLPDS